MRCYQDLAEVERTRSLTTTADLVAECIGVAAAEAVVENAATERLAPRSASEAQAVVISRLGPVRKRLRMLLTALVLNRAVSRVGPGLWPRQHNARHSWPVQRTG